MFEHLSDYRCVLVSGPQRSGTRFCSVVISEDTGFDRIDETDAKDLFVIGKEFDCVKSLVSSRDKFVLHCPTFSRWAHLIPEAAIVFMRRDVSDILKSEKRIAWRRGRQEIEYSRYGYWRWKKKPGLTRTFKPISTIKYEYWDNVQKELTKHPFDIEYESLYKHHLWVPQNDRTNFRWNQYHS